MIIFTGDVQSNKQTFNTVTHSLLSPNTPTPLNGGCLSFLLQTNYVIGWINTLTQCNGIQDWTQSSDMPPEQERN